MICYLVQSWCTVGMDCTDFGELYVIEGESMSYKGSLCHIRGALVIIPRVIFCHVDSNYPFS